jgi:hypothetical protein
MTLGHLPGVSVNRGRCVALFLCVVATGCGFRSGLDAETFVLESFSLDHEALVQGQTGIATAGLRNVGPRVARVPEVSLGTYDLGESMTFVPQSGSPEVAPGGTVFLSWTMTPSEAAPVGPTTAYAKLESDPDNGLSAPLDIRQAATLKASVAFVELADTLRDYTCREFRPALVDATVTNVGDSPATVTLPTILVSQAAASVQDLFEIQAADSNPDSLAAGATAVFHFEITAHTQAAPGEGYSLVFGATVVDATTGHARAAPTPFGDAPLLRVDVKATLELAVEEVATVISSAAPDAGAVQIHIHNAGTVPARIDEGGLDLSIGDNTNAQYAITSPSITFPFTVGPGDDATIAFPAVTLTSGTPTLGATLVRGDILGFDTLCDTTLSGATDEVDSGSWAVQ